MRVEIKIDRACDEPRVVVQTAEVTEEVRELVKRVENEFGTRPTDRDKEEKPEEPHTIAGIRDEKVEILEQEDIVNVFANGGKVFAVTEKGEYVLRLRLYEAERRLAKDRFVRISNSEIINLKKVDHFDLSFAGTICVRLINGTTTYVSRRQVAKLKKILGI